MLRKLNMLIISVLAFLLGVNYCIFPWLDYNIIGIKGDFMSSARNVWGIVQTVLGMFLLLFLAFKQHIHILHKYWTIVLSVVFVMQLPMASLWYMTLMRLPLGALLGVLIHTLLITLISIDYVTSHRTVQKTVDKPAEDEINLDT